MCQPKPGPRCSSHARDTLTRSTKNFQHRDSEYNEELGRLEGMPFDSAEAQSQRSYLDTLAHGRAEAETRMHEAREDYDATPDGMKDIRLSLKHNSGDGSLQGQHTKHQLEQRFQRARARRNAQILALRTLQSYTSEQKAG